MGNDFSFLYLSNPYLQLVFHIAELVIALGGMQEYSGDNLLEIAILQGLYSDFHGLEFSFNVLMFAQLRQFSALLQNKMINFLPVVLTDDQSF